MKLVDRSICCLALVVGATLGCGSSGYGPADNPTMVHDVTGVAFAWRCDVTGCQLGMLPETPPPDACTGTDSPTYGWASGRFFEACSVCAPQDGSYVYSTTAGQCRLLGCSTSADCPIMYEDSPTDVYECVNGLCQNADQTRWPRMPLKRYQTEELCFAVHDRAETRTWTAPAAMQVEAELDASCAGDSPLDPCSLPAGCRMP